MEEGGAQAIPDAMELQESLPTQTLAESAAIVNIYPKNSVDNDQPICFRVVTGDSEMLVPSEMLLYCYWKVLDDKGKDIANENEDLQYVLPTNGFTYSFFKDISVKLNDETITESSNTYPYVADFQTRLGHSRDVKEKALELALFREEHVAYEDIDADVLAFPKDKKDFVDNNEHSNVFGNRFNLTRNSQKFGGVNKLFSEIFNQPKWLPPNTAMEIKLTRHDPTFSLLCKKDNKKYTICLMECYLAAKIVTVQKDHVRRMELSRIEDKKPYIFPLKKTRLVSYSRNRGVRDLSQTELVNGTLPRKVYVALVASEAFNGNYKLDPFNYQHYHVSSVTCRVGNQSMPMQGIATNYRQKEFLPALASLLSATDSLFCASHDIGIDRHNYMARNVIYGFDLDPIRGQGFEVYELKKRGKLDLEIKLDEITPDGVTVLVYMEFDAELRIDDQNRLHRTW